jgi:hypothetical protein
VDSPYRTPAEWTLVGEHRIGTLYRLGFLAGALATSAVTVVVVRSLLAARESPSVAVLVLSAFIAVLALFFSFVAARASVGAVRLYREGITLGDLRGASVRVAWTDVRRVVRFFSSAGRTGRRFAGWSIEHGQGQRLFVPVMYEGVGRALEAMATEADIPIGDEHV